MSNNDITKVTINRKTTSELMSEEQTTINELNEEYFQLAMEFVNNRENLTVERAIEIEKRSCEIKSRLAHISPVWLA